MNRHPIWYNMGVSKNRCTPKWMVKIMENPIKTDDLGIWGGKRFPYFRFNIHISHRGPWGNPKFFINTKALEKVSFHRWCFRTWPEERSPKEPWTRRFLWPFLEEGRLVALKSLGLFVSSIHANIDSYWLQQPPYPPEFERLSCEQVVKDDDVRNSSNSKEQCFPSASQ